MRGRVLCDTLFAVTLPGPSWIACSVAPLHRVGFCSRMMPVFHGFSAAFGGGVFFSCDFHGLASLPQQIPLTNKKTNLTCLRS